MMIQLQSAAPRPAPPEIAGDPSRSDFERVGGEAGLMAIISEFVADVFADAMIGFLFAGKSQARITTFEYRFAAAQLGAPVVYDGRPLGDAHRQSPISSGHFDRRAKILADALLRHAVPSDVSARWLAHVDAQRATILGTFPDACERP